MNNYFKKTALAIALAPPPTAHIETRITGLYRIEAFKQDANGNEIPGSRRVAADWFHNLIVDAGMDLIGGAGDFGTWFAAARVGTGSTLAANTDTGLVSQLAATTTINATTNGAAGTAPYYGWMRRTFRFAAGVATGNISEVGIATAATGGVLFSRALTVDGAGNPITITVLSDELLDVVYEFRLYPPTADIAWGPLTISGVSYSGTMRPIRVTTSSSGGQSWVPPWSGVGPKLGHIINSIFTATDLLGATEATTLVAQTGGNPASPSAISAANTTPPGTVSAYVTGTFYRDHQFLINLNYANFGTGIGSLYVSTLLGMWQMNFTPKVAKTASHRFTIHLRTSWARHVF